MIDYISAAFLIIGYFVAGKKNKWGWCLSSIGNIGYIWVSISAGLWGMLGLSVVMLAVSIYNFFIWHAEQRVRDKMFADMVKESVERRAKD